MKDRYSLYWDDGAVVAVDQRALPHTLVWLRLTDVGELITAIQTLAIRGAPALGIAGAFGVALAAQEGRAREAVLADTELLEEARPTAVNLSVGVRRARNRFLDGGRAAALAEAEAMLGEDERTNYTMAAWAAAEALRLCGNGPLRVLTHCNTGRLATAAHGTAIGAIKDLAGRGKIDTVLVDETRPLLQGARLTAWELSEEDIPHRVCVDSAAAWAMASGEVDCVLVGADRVAANGDVANKIGTYSLAVAARRHGIPFLVVAPESTRDPSVASGDEIVVEQRSDLEVTEPAGVAVTPRGTPAYNPAFDVTPAALVTALVTERGVFPSAGTVSRAQGTGSEDALARRVLDATTLHPDFPRAGVNFRDLGGVLADPALLGDLTEALSCRVGGPVDAVVAVEARGFPYGAALARHLDAPLVLVRKPGKLPGPTYDASYSLEYGADTLHLMKGAVPSGARVLVVDDVAATGGTLEAAAELVTRAGGSVVGVATVLSLIGLGARERLASYPYITLCEVEA
ncbi:S-methyl-5-thioribose-1-phosphate isomerase [Nocardiopsis sp. L17-MgMaSL7]|uniref:S-methyl-5-thioribose-1-phosphate isomerase n=1 Tax=Nocardiopsis sp. L17-MgMaSL7 TaxID=1938893 RepID=UPI000D719FCF|nr:S-methyl-5-thioribose-1-phosphate isomerase [Nocardiopsis sp. L17-MgMaSL7]PWV58088.1 methylthioribulose-1-phosphate dehydratase [Nocardiopsis sp. L17-MgMaSL7]